MDGQNLSDDGTTLQAHGVPEDASEAQQQQTYNQRLRGRIVSTSTCLCCFRILLYHSTAEFF